MNTDEIIAIKRKQFVRWVEMIAGARSLVPLFPVLNKGVCPSGCPVFAHDRDYVQSEMRKRGIHMKIHWQLPFQVGDEFRNSKWVSSRIFTLPIYPDSNQREQNFIAEMMGSGKL